MAQCKCCTKNKALVHTLAGSVDHFFETFPPGCMTDPLASAVTTVLDKESN